MALGRLPLIGGSYSARSVIANCQRCVNLYPENNTKDASSSTTHYQRGGYQLGAVCPNPGLAQFLYQASNGDGYAVVAGSVYYIDPELTWHKIGDAPGNSPGLTANPCSMQDNGIQVLLGNGSSLGWLWNLGDHGAASYEQITDSNFTGLDRVDYIDTFLIWNIPGGQLFQSSLSNQIQPMDGTYIAAKTDYPDPLQTLIVNRHEILLIGTYKSEIWYDAGNPQFPFAELPGAYIEHGTSAKYSIASADISVYWLGRDLQSGAQGMVFRQRGYETKRISNFALEYQIQQMIKAGNVVSDAVGSTYQAGGHVFYRLVFPSANQTWIYDESAGDPDLAWSQRCWTDGNGTLNRDRGVFDAALYGNNCVLDWQTGALLIQNPDQQQDYGPAGLGPIAYLRTFPHLMSGTDPKTGQIILANGRLVQHSRFQLDVECGTSGDTSPPPQFSLRWSDDRGKTWGNTVLQSAGALGQYTTRPDWRGVGMAMDRVYEISWSFTGPCALNGAWVEGTVLAQ